MLYRIDEYVVSLPIGLFENAKLVRCWMETKSWLESSYPEQKEITKEESKELTLEKGDSMAFLTYLNGCARYYTVFTVIE